MTKPSELKPCPFCGGEAEIHDSINLIGGRFARCKSCFSMGKTDYLDSETIKA